MLNDTPLIGCLLFPVSFHLPNKLCTHKASASAFGRAQMKVPSRGILSHLSKWHSAQLLESRPLGFSLSLNDQTQVLPVLPLTSALTHHLFPSSWPVSSSTIPSGRWSAVCSPSQDRQSCGQRTGNSPVTSSSARLVLA